jgi:hypothetical protein
MVMPRPHLSALLASATALAVSGCATDFLPESYLDGLRVLAIVSDPTELGPGEAVTLAPTVYSLPADPVTSTAWSFCPLTLGSPSGYACALPACEVPLVPGPGGTVTQDPTALALDCLARLGTTPPPGFVPGEVPETIETVFRLRVESASGDVREAVKRVLLHTRGAPASRNRPPVIAGVELDGAAATPGAVAATIPPGSKARLTVRVDPASVDSYLDGNGRTVVETVVVGFFSTAGRLDDERGSAPVAETFLVAKELEAGQTEAQVWVVARDLRGGEAVAGPFRVAITP